MMDLLDAWHLLYRRGEAEATNLGGGEDVLDGLGNLRADTVTLDQTDEVVSLVSVC